MSTRSTAFAPGTPCWVNLISSDPDASSDFYRRLLDWTVEDLGEQYGNYRNFHSGGLLVAGLMPNVAAFGAPDSWTTYLAVDDVEATVAAATAAGAQVLAPGMQVGEQGWLAVLADPAGAVFGVWQPGKHTGFQRYNELGSVTWDEVHSKDFTASTDFYATVFGWTYDAASDTDDFRYFTGQVAGEPVAGLMDSHAFLPPEVPSHWKVYFSVADADATIAKATSLGATVQQPAGDTPFGRLAALVDPTGAAFSLHQVIG